MPDQRRRGPVRGGSKASSAAIVQVAATKRPGIVHAQRRPAEVRQIDQPAQARLRLGKQPGAAGEPRVAVGEGPEVGAAPRARNRRDGVEVHARPIDEPAGALAVGANRPTADALYVPQFILLFYVEPLARQARQGFASGYVERTGSGRSSARMAISTKAAPPRMVKIEAMPCTAMPAAATASSEPTPVGVLRAAP